MNSGPIIPRGEPDYLGTPAIEEMAAPPARLRWRKFFSALRAYWWVPALTLVLGVSIAVFLFFHTPPIFTSVAGLWEAQKLRLPDGAAFTEDTQNFLGTQSELLRSDYLRQKALNTLEAAGTVRVPRDDLGKPAEVKIRVTQAPKSAVFWVEATSSDPAFTPAFLDALIQVYMEYKQTARKEIALGTLSSISEQVQRLELKVKADQNAWTEFQKTNNLGVFEQDKVAAGTYLAKLKTQLSDYELDGSLLDAALVERSAPLFSETNNASWFGAQAGSGSVLASGPGAAALDSQKQIELLKMQRDRLDEFLLPQHPKIVKLNEEIERAQKQAEIYAHQTRDQILAARQALDIKIAGVKSLIAEWEQRLVAANARIAAGDGLKQDLDRDRALFEKLIGMLENVDISRNIDQDTLTVLEPASLAKRSYKDALNNLVLSVFLGLGSGLGIVWLIGMRDDRFGTILEVTENLGDAVVGQVPELPQPKKGAPLALLEPDDDRHIYAESYRSLRSALLFLASEGDRPKVLLVTSAVPNEGKSTIATNLARSLALGGARVLLVDGDLRKGHLHELLQLESKPGLAEVLQQPGLLDQIIQTNSLANFHFLPRGTVPTNPGDLILNSAFGDILARLREQFDYVIVDSSPVFAADDAATLAPKVDGTLFVVRSQFSRAGAVREAIELLTRRQARVLGLVLNRADASARSYYYYKYTDYYRQDAAATH